MDDSDAKTKVLLERTVALVEENNMILRKMHRRMKWGSFFHILYWVLIIGITLGSYYFLQPYLESALGVYGSLSESAGTLPDISSILENFAPR